MVCYGCTETVRRTPEEVEQLVSEQLLFETDLVTEDTYQKRLAHCFSCDQLDYDTTCRVCGCFVQFRARLSYKACPNIAEKRWDKVNT